MRLRALLRSDAVDRDLAEEMREHVDHLVEEHVGGDPAIVGQSISLSGVPHTVVGVMGSDFAFPSREYQIWTPLTFDPNELINRQNYSYLAVARLKPGATLQQASADMHVISAQL